MLLFIFIFIKNIILNIFTSDFSYSKTRHCDLPKKISKNDKVYRFEFCQASESLGMTLSLMDENQVFRIHAEKIHEKTRYIFHQDASVSQECCCVGRHDIFPNSRGFSYPQNAILDKTVLQVSMPGSHYIAAHPIWFTRKKSAVMDSIESENDFEDYVYLIIKIA